MKRPPFCVHASPSCCSSSASCRVRPWSSMSTYDGLSRQSIPAVCQVVPAVSECASSSSVASPCRWRAKESAAPTTPPPTTTTSYCSSASGLDERVRACAPSGVLVWRRAALGEAEERDEEEEAGSEVKESEREWETEGG
eukprot:scaffold40252_cov28-Tisochrysis_lutea.AAC.4